MEPNISVFISLELTVWVIFNKHEKVEGKCTRLSKHSVMGLECVFREVFGPSVCQVRLIILSTCYIKSLQILAR